MVDCAAHGILVGRVSYTWNPVNRTPGMAPHMAPIFIKLLSRLQRPPSTRSLIANEAAMESSALALSGLRFKFPRGSNAFLRSKLKRTTAPDSFFAPPVATVAAAGSVWGEHSADHGK